MTNENLDSLNLDALEGDDGMTLEEIEASAKDLLWASDEMPPPENIAYSMRRIDSGLSELLEFSARTSEATERIANSLERIATAAEGAAKALHS